MKGADNMLLKKLKLLVDDSNASDDVLSLYLDIAKKKILNRVYPYDNTKTEVPSKYEHVQLEIASYLYNKRGGEGETQHSENGILRTYESASVPESMLKDVVPFVGIPK